MDDLLSDIMVLSWRWSCLDLLWKLVSIMYGVGILVFDEVVVFLFCWSLFVRLSLLSYCTSNFEI